MSQADRLSYHLPAFDMVVTADGPIFTLTCSCGWDDPTPQRLAEKAGREYDRHLALTEE